MADGPPEGTIRRNEPVMGTVVSFDIRPGAADRAEIFLALAKAKTRLHRADAVFSTWKPDSPLSRLRRGEIELTDTPDEVQRVLERSALAREMSGGWFDPWALPGGVDPTGLVKGWATALALDAIVECGVEGAMASAGGDIALYGRPDADRAWRIGIQNPWDRATVIAVVEPPAAIATSGAYERGLHVLDPRTGEPADKVASATVTGPALDLADAFATGLFAGGEEALEPLAGLDLYEAMIVRPDGSMAATGGFPFA